MPLRIAFFGTPAFAVPTLDALLASDHDVVGVVTQPDRPRGRGQQITEAPVKERARIAGVPILQPTKLKDPEFLDAFRAWNADLGVVAAYGRLLPQVLLDIPPRGLINVHASLLPAWRGASPIQRAVLNGDRVSGVTIMRVVLALDAGRDARARRGAHRARRHDRLARRPARRCWRLAAARRGRSHGPRRGHRRKSPRTTRRRRWRRRSRSRMG